ncbi:hypothetical protein ACSBR2_008548 [Camellia fascicularis]
MNQLRLPKVVGMGQVFCVFFKSVFENLHLLPLHHQLGFPGFQALRRCQWRRKSIWTRCSSARTTVTSGTLISWAPFRTTFHDGSCNGLQHYAALGRDKLAAAAVNLVAGEKPADVYSGIAARYTILFR